MASVKWLKEIRAVDGPFEGIQQVVTYNYRQYEDDPGTPVTRKFPHALMIPPGIPDFLSRERRVEAGRIHIEGRAWSGFGPIEKVEFSADGGESWEDARLDESVGRYAWTSWAHEWNAQPGEYELCTRATDTSGRTQTVESDEAWNQGGYGVNVVQRVPVTVE
jgi:DMSO/TMAO reductase YedYZ molybdopterin-dependent catalytic subunit